MSAEGTVVETADGDPAGCEARGDAALARGDLAEALACFEAAAANDRNVPLRLKIAQTCHALARYDAAAAAYRAVLELAPDDLSALIGLAEALSAGGAYESALATFEAAAALEPDNMPLRIRIADMWRALARFAEAERGYYSVLAADPGNAACFEHLGDCAVGRGEPVTALAWYEAAEQAGPDPSDEVLLKKAAVLKALSRLEAAEAAYAAVLARTPRHARALIGLAETVSARGEFARALSLFESAVDVAPSGPALQVRIADMLRACGRSHDAELAYLKVLHAHPGRIDAQLGIALVESDRLNLAAALAILEGLVTLEPANAGLRFHASRLQRDLDRVDDAAATLRAAEAACAVDPAIMQTKWLEHYCATLQLQAAAACIEAWGGHRNVPPGAVMLAARTYAELGRWSDVLAFVRERIVESRWHGQFPDLAELVLRAARGTGRYADAFELLDALRENVADNSARRVFDCARDQIVEETRVMRLLAGEGVAPVAPPAATIADPFRAWRADLVTSALAGRPRAAPRLRVLWCADRNYLGGLVVSLFSCLAHNLDALRDRAFTVYCSDDVLDLGKEACEKVGALFRVPIDVRSSATLVSPDVTLRTQWGLFRSGAGLTAAAYHRIYAVQRLLAEGHTGRALYIDADTCVQAGLDELAAFDLAGMPLGACRDEQHLISFRAAGRVGADPASYFNSGVMLFDLDHPELGPRLDRSIEFASTEPHRLTFVDQCALNAAFAGNVTLMPERYNVFVKSDTPPERIARNAFVLHYVMTPKPWDPIYPTNACEQWLREFAGLTHVLEPGLLRRLAALPFNPANAAAASAAAID